eukprot:scaffold23306_cov125-Isochrysis_galbana.AAC.16
MVRRPYVGSPDPTQGVRPSRTYGRMVRPISRCWVGGVQQTFSFQAPAKIEHVIHKLEGLHMMRRSLPQLHKSTFQLQPN